MLRSVIAAFLHKLGPDEVLIRWRLVRWGFPILGPRLFSI
jgi:hypothetical protein